MKIARDILNFDVRSVEDRIKGFIKNYVGKCDAKGVVIGVSGGLDSSVTVALASRSLDGCNVLGVAMPENETYNATDIQHAELLEKKFGFILEKVDISSTLKSYFETLPAYDNNDRLSNGNLKARIRMSYLYYYANRLDRLVCGTSDKSETMMGYFTKWGDVAADISPIMDLYKTQVKQLASHIGIPAEIVSKPPSPRLWPGQLAEEELGIKYEILDLVLYGLQHFMTSRAIADQLQLDIKIVRNIRRRWLETEHKRRLPLTPNLGF